jgi:hypothetical protein
MGTTKANEILDKQLNLNEVLVSWEGPSHPFKRRNRTFYQTVAAITFLCVAIVFFLHEFLLIGVILSIAFVVYVLSTVPPVPVINKVTPLGFEHSGRLFRWMELSAFWFEKQWDETVLVVATRLPYPAQVRVVVKSVTTAKLKEVIGKYLEYKQKPPKNFIDRISDWLSQRIVLDSAS